ncbi:MAG: hypothetical protein KGJ07_06055 [Patescibacteria group bacterium]|nr:hypothetical protein [Patescibacteria group bacterium]MDE2591216.1 hypothetical protein [Patescibacteria group bacterium]
MMLGFLFILELVALFLLSRIFSKMFSQMLLTLTRSQTLTIQVLSIILLPGVILHELAHWFVAGMLLVPTGEMEFIPQIQGNSVKLGSVAVAKTDPFRRFLIGVAPVLIGLAAMFGIFAYFSASVPQVNWQTLLLIYVFFEIGNTMFSSRKDMEGAAFLLGFLVVCMLLFYFLGFRLNLTSLELFLAQPIMVSIFLKADIMLLFPLGINTLLCLPRFIRMR